MHVFVNVTCRVHPQVYSNPPTITLKQEGQVLSVITPDFIKRKLDEMAAWAPTQPWVSCEFRQDIERGKGNPLGDIEVTVDKLWKIQYGKLHIYKCKPGHSIDINFVLLKIDLDCNQVTLTLEKA